MLAIILYYWDLWIQFYRIANDKHPIYSFSTTGAFSKSSIQVDRVALQFECPTIAWLYHSHPVQTKAFQGKDTRHHQKLCFKNDIIPSLMILTKES